MKWDLFRILFLEKFCTARGLSAKTIATYSEALIEFEKYLVDLKNGPTPEKLTTVDICDYIQYLREQRGNGHATVNKKATVLRVFYRAMVALEMLQPNQDPCVRLPKLKKPQEKVGDILSLAEIERLAAAPEATTLLGLRDRAILLLLCTTGIRASECASIKEKDVDLENRMVRVLGKGNRQRVVMLNDLATLALQNYIAFRGSQGVGEAFFKVRTGKGIDRRRIFERVKYYVKKVRIFKKISPHRLRHSFATKMIKDGIGLATLKELLGHRNLQSTMRYIQISGEELRAAIGKLNIDDAFERVVALLPMDKLRYQRPFRPQPG
jgi:site-specific recombinase XerD